MTEVFYLNGESANIPGSTGCQPVIVGSLPTTLRRIRALRSEIKPIVLGWQPSTAGWQPAVPGEIRNI
jgi:hypothetical protein